MGYHSAYKGSDIDAAVAAARKITNLLTVDITINVTFAAGVAQTFTAACTGAAVGDVCLPYSGIAGGYAAQTIGGANALVITGCWVSAADVVSVRAFVPITSGVAYNFTMKVLVLKLNLA
jgi:hypothetical protein